MAGRKNFSYIVIGSQGSGKTLFMLNICDDYLNNHPKKRNLWGLPDDSEEKLDSFDEIPAEAKHLKRFEGIKKVMVENIKFFDLFRDCFFKKNSENSNKAVDFNGLFIIDDAGAILTRRDERMLKVVKRRRQTNMDVIMSFHGLRNDVPPSLFTFVNRIILFKTTDAHEGFLDVLPSNKREEFLEMYERVQAHEDQYYCEELIIKSEVND